MKKMKIQGRTALVLAALIGVSSLGMAFAGILGGQELQARMARGRQVWPTRADQVVALEGQEESKEEQKLNKTEEPNANIPLKEEEKGPKVINEYQVIPIPMTYEEIMKAYNTVVVESQMIEKNKAQWEKEPQLENPATLDPGMLSNAALLVIADLLNVYRVAGGYQPIVEVKTDKYDQAYAALCANGGILSHSFSEVVNASNNKNVPSSVKEDAAKAGLNCLCRGLPYLADIRVWMGEGYSYGQPVSDPYKIGHRLIHMYPKCNLYRYGISGKAYTSYGFSSTGRLDYTASAKNAYSATPRIFPPVGQLPKPVVPDGASLMVDFRETSLKAGDDFEVEVYVPNQEGMYDISSPNKAAAVYTVSAQTISVGEEGSFASVMPPWQDQKVYEAQGRDKSDKAGDKPFIYGLILRNVIQADGTKVSMATANVLPETNEAGAKQKPDKAVSENLSDQAYTPVEASLEKIEEAIRSQIKKYFAPTGNEDSVLKSMPGWTKDTVSSLKNSSKDSGSSSGSTGNEGGNTGNTGGTGNDGNSGSTGNSGSSGNTGNSGSSSGNKAGQSGDGGQHTSVVDGDADEGWFRQVKTLKASPKWFWTINAGRMQAFLHKHGLDEKSFEEKYHTTVQKVLDQYADELVSAEDLEDLMKRQFFGPYEGEDYMLSLSRALQATGYSYYAQFNLMDWSADYSNIYGLTPEADPMAEWRMNPVQYVVVQTNPDGTPVGEDGEGGESSGESQRSNRRTRQTQASEEETVTETSATAAEEPATGEENQEEPTAPSAVESQGEAGESEAQSGPTTIPADNTPTRRRRGTAPKTSEEAAPSESAEQETQPAGN